MGNGRKMWLLIFKIVLSLLFVNNVHGQGRMLTPAGRSSLWRYGYETPINDNDNVLNCGGNKRRWEKNGGKCGVCGDPWDMTHRENEAGGRYAQGVISGEYLQGSVIKVEIEIAIESGGYFEFRLCANNDFTKAVTQDCLDKGLLYMKDGKSTKYEQINAGINEIYLKLPEGLDCDQCVLQWKYRTADQYGCDTDTVTNQTVCGYGYGKMQTEYYACADVAIYSKSVNGDQHVMYNIIEHTFNDNRTESTISRTKRQISPNGPHFVMNEMVQYASGNDPVMMHTLKSRPNHPFSPPDTVWGWRSDHTGAHQNGLSRTRRRTQQHVIPIQESIQVGNPHLNGVMSTTLLSSGRVRKSFNRRHNGLLPLHNGPVPTLIAPTEPSIVRTHSSASFGGDSNRMGAFTSNSNPTISRQITFQKVSRSRPALLNQAGRSRIHRKFLDPMSANLGHSSVAVHTVTQKILRGASQATSTRQCQYCPFDQCLDDKLRLDALFPGLFENPTQLLECKKYERLFTVGNYDVIKDGLPSCSHPRFKRQLQQRRPFDDDDVGCCGTRPQVILPLTVEADNDTFSVVQLGDSKKQFIVQGICGKSTTSACTVCAAENNFQWVLVYDPRVDKNPPVSFVPVKFPHYCRCYNYRTTKG